MSLPQPHWNPNGAYNTTAVGGGGIFQAFQAIGDANRNWTQARDTAMHNGFHTGNYSGLPNGTHYQTINGCTERITKRSENWIVKENLGSKDF
jgi:hypothetical protein